MDWKPADDPDTIGSIEYSERYRTTGANGSSSRLKCILLYVFPALEHLGALLSTGSRAREETSIEQDDFSIIFVVFLLHLPTLRRGDNIQSIETEDLEWFGVILPSKPNLLALPDSVKDGELARGCNGFDILALLDGLLDSNGS